MNQNDLGFTPREKEIAADLQWMLDNPDKLVWVDGDEAFKKLGIPLD